MKDYVEPYLKENNVIQLGLFYYGDKRPTKRIVEWGDSRGDYRLKITCEYGIPGSLEHDLYTVIMKMWLLRGVKNPKITLNYSDIARELGLQPKNWVTRIKKSLQRLATTQYEFIECFVKANEDGNNKITTYFSLFDTVHLYESNKNKSKRNSKSELIFPNEIVENVQANYYQLLDMVWYRSLPDGLPRRLYEFLAKKYYLRKGNIFKISEEAICRWLPITDKNPTKRKKRMERIAQSLINAGFLKSYGFEKPNKMCSFEYSKDIRAKRKEGVIEIEYERNFDDPILQEDEHPTIEQGIVLEKRNSFTEKELKILFGEVKNVTENIKKIIEDYYREKGFDYVMWNIRYANANAKKSYYTYLCRTLKENWGINWREEQIQKATNEKLLREEEENKYQEEVDNKMLISEQMNLFEKEHDKLSWKEKNAMWLKAEKLTDENAIGRSMMVKVEYAQLVREKLGEKGLEFNGESLSLEFVKKIAIKPVK